MDQPLIGRVAIVTGSSRRIGRAIALELSSRGCDLVINGRSDPKAAAEVVTTIQQRGGRAIYCIADVGVPEQAQRLIDSAVHAFGRIDILVNNAAVRRAMKFSELTFNEWREIFSVVLDGAFLCAQAASPHLSKNGLGRIVNVGGIIVHTGAKDRAHVVSAKAGLVGLTKSLALDLAINKTTVNCIAPGAVEDEGDNEQAIKVRRQNSPIEKIPLARPGTSEEVAKVVSALCGDDFAFMTGQTLHLNGGAYMN